MSATEVVATVTPPCTGVKSGVVTPKDKTNRKSQLTKSETNGKLNPLAGLLIIEGDSRNILLSGEQN